MDRFLRILAGCTLTMAAVVGAIAIYSGNQDLDRATAQDSQAELSAAETEFNQENRVPVEVAPNGELLENHIGAGEVPRRWSVIAGSRTWRGSFVRSDPSP